MVCKPFVKWAGGKRRLLPELELLLKNVPYDSIFGHRGRTEFVLVSEKLGLRLRIEAKW